jgi:ubiquinone/menaquinone biosynthesis C-methylase UbiE
MSTADLERSVVETAYSRSAPIYDAVCGPVMVKGRRAAAAAARAIGGRILEVGVGTGLSFDDYDASTDITGIDLCAPMRAKAREKMASGCYPWVSDVQLMDAHQLGFADASFDCAVAQFVITVIASPEQVLSECRRVVKPGGRSSSSIISIRKPASPRRSNAGPPSAPARSACGLDFRSHGCRPGRNRAGTPTSSSGARWRRSTRWFVSNDGFRPRRESSSRCHGTQVAARAWEVTL